jgi:hypothetical protein
MEKKYYIVKKENQGSAFMVGLENKLKHIAGNKSITKMMKFEEGDLKPKDSTSGYNIFLLNELQFDVCKEQYKSGINKDF